MRLNTRLSLYGMVDRENEISDTERVPAKLKDMWVNIKPTLGNQKSYGGTEMETVENIQTIQCRILEIKNPSIDMYFMDSRGWKYEFISFIPSYKDRNIWDIKTRITYE